MSDHAPRLPDDLLDVAAMLDRQRPQLDNLELDGLKRRTMRASRTTHTNTHKGTFMRSRTAITALLASGLLMSGGGTALGVSALQATGNASQSQYGTVAPTSTPDNSGTLGEQGGGGGGDTLPASEGDGTGEVAAKSAAGTNAVQAARQVGTSSGESLPFTGYAAIPVLLLGLFLFAAGLVLHRRPAQR